MTPEPNHETEDGLSERDSIEQRGRNLASQIATALHSAGLSMQELAGVTVDFIIAALHEQDAAARADQDRKIVAGLEAEHRRRAALAGDNAWLRGNMTGILDAAEFVFRGRYIQQEPPTPTDQPSPEGD